MSAFILPIYYQLITKYEKMFVMDEEKQAKKSLKKFKFHPLISGIVIGLILFAGIKYLTYKPPEHVHYHANFAVSINGQKEKFENPLYYQEIVTCAVDNSNDPAHRAHIHDNVNDLVHVHDGAVTWGNFFQNLGWNIGKGYIDNNQKLYTDDPFNKMTFILNGQEVSDVTNKVIGSTDRLLIDYGSQSKDEIKKEFDQIANSAKKANETQDPSTCSGNTENASVKDRLKNIF